MYRFILNTAYLSLFLIYSSNASDINVLTEDDEFVIAAQLSLEQLSIDNENLSINKLNEEYFNLIIEKEIKSAQFKHDEEIALQLSQSSDFNEPDVSDPLLDQYNKIQQFCLQHQQILNQYANNVNAFNQIATASQDVRIFNRNVIHKYRQIITDSFKIIKFDTTPLTPDSVVSNLRNTLNSVSKYSNINTEDNQAFESNLIKLLSHLKANNGNGDAETGFNALDTIMRVCKLASIMDNEDIGILRCGLLDNIATGGGCYAGYMGRLIQGYMQLILNIRYS